MTFRIARAHARDLVKLKPLWKEMIHSYREISDGVWEVREPQEAWQRRHQQYLNWINEADGVVFLAFDEEEVPVGYAAMHYVESGATFDFGESWAELESLVVDADHHHEGIGTALLSACRKELERREIRYWSLNTLTNHTDALRLYERHGFQPFMTRLVQRLGDDPDA